MTDPSMFKAQLIPTSSNPILACVHLHAHPTPQDSVTLSRIPQSFHLLPIALDSEREEVA